MRWRVIFNPASGRNRHRPDFELRIRDFLQRHRVEADVVVTTGPGHATALAREALAAGCTQVAAAGGDGTLNEVARALTGTNGTLALVPCGSGNGLALHLGIPTRWTQALELLLPGRARPMAIDTGQADGHPFFNVMGLGFDAEISRSFNGLAKRGLAAYVRTGMKVFARHRPEWFEISDDRRTVALPAFVVTVANSSQYGNNARIAPQANVADGLLDLVAIRDLGLLSAAPLLARLFLGRLRDSKRVYFSKSVRFVIRRERPGVIHVDGETRECGTSIAIGAVPASLRVLVPAGAPAG